VGPSSPRIAPPADGTPRGNKGVDRELLFSDEDGVEIFEVDGDKTDLPPSASTLQKSHKVRPNDPCPCGSGKKYKKCCGVQ